MRWGFWLAVTCVAAAGFYAVGAAEDASGDHNTDREEATTADRRWRLLKKPFRVRSAFSQDEDAAARTPSGRVSWQHGAPRAAGSAARSRYTRSAEPTTNFATETTLTRDFGRPGPSSAAALQPPSPGSLPPSGALTGGRPLPPSLATGHAATFRGQDTPIPGNAPTAPTGEPQRLPWLDHDALPADGETAPENAETIGGTNPGAPSAFLESPATATAAGRSDTNAGAATLEPAEYLRDGTDDDVVVPAASVSESGDSSEPTLVLDPPPASGATAPLTGPTGDTAEQPQPKPNVSFTPVPGIQAAGSDDAADLFPIAPQQDAETLPAGTSGHQPQITLHWEAASAINVGQQATLRLRVKNSGQGDAHDVEIQAFFPVSVRLTDATPRPAAATDRLVWRFESLAAGEEKTFQIALIPSERGQLVPAATVRYSATAAGDFTVREPMLKLAVRGPQKVMMGDPASQVAIIGNPGTGAAENVTLEVRVPDGLEHPRGKHLMLELGTLNPGETRTVRLSLVAVSGGTQTLDLVATADGGLKQTERVTVSVIAPQLELAVKGPSIRYLGRTAEYAVTVRNGGQAPSNNIQIVYQVPEGFQFVGADRGAHYDATERTVHWFLGRLEPEASATVRLKLLAAKLGEYVHRVRAASEHGISAQAEATSRIDGTASLILEVVDLDDPVEVGAETAYEVRVRNEGSKAASNVGLTCELPAGVQLIGVKGPTAHLKENGLIVFKPLAGLGPKQTATFRIHVRAAQPGDQRFRVRLTSESIQEPLLVEELTKFYQD